MSMTRYPPEHIPDRIIEEIKNLIEVAQKEYDRLQSTSPSRETQEAYDIACSISLVGEYITRMEFLADPAAWEAKNPDLTKN